jgi:hypothetical protein
VKAKQEVDKAPPDSRLTSKPFFLGRVMFGVGYLGFSFACSS